jgi:hypothetical protein
LRPGGRGRSDRAERQRLPRQLEALGSGRASKPRVRTRWTGRRAAAAQLAAEKKLETPNRKRVGRRARDFAESGLAAQRRFLAARAEAQALERPSARRRFCRSRSFRRTPATSGLWRRPWAKMSTLASVAMPATVERERCDVGRSGSTRRSGTADWSCSSSRR